MRKQIKVESAQTIRQEQFLKLLKVGLDGQAYRFVRQSAEGWLAIYPNDQSVGLYLAQALYHEGRVEDAIADVRHLLALDPTFLEGYLTLASMEKEHSEKNFQVANAYAYALGAQNIDADSVPEWSQKLLRARAEIAGRQYEIAEITLNQVLAQPYSTALVDLTHLTYIMRYQSEYAVLSLAQLYHQRWPECIQFNLVYADALMEIGSESEGMAILQQMVTLDPTGKLARSLWGEDHRYQRMWPAELSVRFDFQIPVDIAVRLGWNQLTAGEQKGAVPNFDFDVDDITPSVAPAADLRKSVDIHFSEKQNKAKQPKEAPEHVYEYTESLIELDDESVNAVFEKVSKSLRNSSFRDIDGRFPMYVIMTSKTALEKKFGVDSAGVLIEKMRELARVIQRKPNWGAMVYLPDDAESLATLNMNVVEDLNPWQIKLSLADLDQALGKKGSMIDALLIVGGDEIIPFHHLPNPTDDADADVNSDNPYGTVDSNYFVPEWPVGRFPDEAGNDPGILLAQLRNAIQYHEDSNAEADGATQSLSFPFELLMSVLSQLFGARSPRGKLNSLGYSASIWRRSSIAAYRPIGDANFLTVSPPKTSETLETLWISEAEFAYFNLHGIEDGAEWFGQKDYADHYDGPDYPIAIKPADIHRNPKYSKVILTEACYGAHIDQKTSDESIALKFLSTGCKGLIGSTCIAYGSIQTPLIGADLLAYLFWKRMREGCPIGEALMRAKVEFAREMQTRQGFLDAEDQKTLLSFVLYGDPLAIGIDSGLKSKRIERSRNPEKIKALSSKDVSGDVVKGISQKKIQEVKEALIAYLPGLDDADFRMSQQFMVLPNPESKGIDGKVTALKRHKTGNVVMTFSKELVDPAAHHQYFAKVTIDSTGKMVKLLVSR